MGARAASANTIVWLIFAAFMFTVGYAQTGLGRRIALHLVRLLGHRTLGLGYAVALADLALRAVHAVRDGAQRRNDLSRHQPHSASSTDRARTTALRG